MWSSLKQLIHSDKERCVIVEDGEPKYVILTYEGYQQLQKGDRSSIVRENPKRESIEEVNWEIQDIQDTKEGGGLKIEDLPF